MLNNRRRAIERLLDRLVQKASSLFLPVGMGLIIILLLLMVGVEIGRRKERAETPAKVEAAIEDKKLLCIEYVAELGNELENEKQKNRELLK